MFPEAEIRDNDSDDESESQSDDDRTYSTYKNRFTPQPLIQETTSNLFDFSTDFNFDHPVDTPPASIANRDPPVADSNRVMSI